MTDAGKEAYTSRPKGSGVLRMTSTVVHDYLRANMLL